ncbi:helix-turn-helix domain-containing protein, partial [Herbaspirillum sp. YR522]|uniref:helix-turn-helix domain-containing protein n=1 Tax=Herbaspirillum sp. YR522 TaxID=1144342 RepID=UPI00026F7691
WLAAEPLQALTPALFERLAPELLAAHAASSTAYPTAAPTQPQAVPAPAELAAMLQRFGGNRAAVARHLGISRTTLWRWLRDRREPGEII